MVALTGNETLLVTGQDGKGRPSGQAFQCNTEDIAALASGSTSTTVITALNTVGAGTITAAGIFGKITKRGGAQSGTPFTDTTATAALIIAALPSGANVGTSFKYTYQNTTNAAATITGGTGVTVSQITVVPPNSWAEFLVTYTAAATVTMVGYEAGSLLVLNPETITNLTTVGAGTITGAGIAGGVTNRSGPVAAFTDTTDTAANIIAAQPNASIGQTWEYTYINTTTFTATIAGGTGVTPSVLLSVPQNSWVRYLVTYTAAATLTMVGIATGANQETMPYVSTTISTAGAGTLTAAAIVGQVINRTGPTAAYSDATDTAANIIAAMPNAAIGNTFMLTIKNTVAFAQTLTNGAGVTVSVLTVIPPNSAATYLVTYTAAGTITMVGISIASLAANGAAAPIAVGNTLTATTANFGQTFLLNTASGSVLTLPAATGSGGKIKVVVSATVTTNSHKVLTAPITDLLQGTAMGITTSTGVMKSFQGLQSGAFHSLQMPAAGSTPSGGFQGDSFTLQDIASGVWQVEASYTAGTTPTTPFSTATT